MMVTRYEIVHEVSPFDIATVSQMEIATAFAEERQHGKRAYWRACIKAFEAKEEDNLNNWPGWARCLADKAGLKETDTILNHLNAELFYRLSGTYNPDLAKIARNLKEYSYFNIAWKYRIPKGMDQRIIEAGESLEYQRHVTDLLHDIVEAESTRSLRAHLEYKFNPNNDFERLNKQIQTWRERGLVLAGDSQIPKSKRDHIKMIAAKLESWWLQ